MVGVEEKREKFKVIVKGLKSIYTNPGFIADKDAFDVWFALLGEYDYEILSAATQAYMRTESRIPTPADIIAKAEDMIHPQQLNEMEAWVLVSRAIRNGTYGAEEEFANLPPLVQKAVGNPANIRNWSKTDERTVEGVIQSNFIKTYREVCKNQKEFLKIAPCKQLLERSLKPEYQLPQKMPNEVR